MRRQNILHWKRVSKPTPLQGSAKEWCLGCSQEAFILGFDRLVYVFHVCTILEGLGSNVYVIILLVPVINVGQNIGYHSTKHAKLDEHKEAQ